MDRGGRKSTFRKSWKLDKNIILGVLIVEKHDSDGFKASKFVLEKVFLEKREKIIFF